MVIVAARALKISREKNDIELLKSISQRDVAIVLSDMLIEQETDGLVRAKLSKIRDIVWDEENLPKADGSYQADANRQLQKKQRIKAIIDPSDKISEDEKLNEQQKKLLAENYARLGHLYEIAGHTARENYFREQDAKLQAFTDANPGKVPDKSIMVPGGVNELLFHNPKFNDPKVSVGSIVEKLSTPVSEYIFTQHPTNTNRLDSMKLQRDIATHVEDVIKTGEGLEKLKATIGKFAKEKLVSVDSNFTVFDETNIVINALSNAYHDLDRLYDVAELGLTRRFDGAYDDKQKQALDLKVRFGSWGSAGDKDGNFNIKSENTLEAIILHKKEGADLLAKTLGKIADLPPALADWQARLENAAVAYGNVITEIEHKRKGGNDIALSNAEFERISKDAQTISANLGKTKDLVQLAEDAVEHASDKTQKAQLLAFKRKAKTFGTNLGKIEYRETAEEYSRVMDYLMSTDKAKELFAPEFIEKFLATKLQKLGNDDDAKTTKIKEDNNDANAPIRAELITEMLNKENRPKFIEVARAFMHEAKGEDLRNYKDKGEKGDATIAYHSLRRMELARDFDDMITHHVLAETQGAHNFMETLALQMATTQGEGEHSKRAMLNIVPLFEEADTMAKIPKVIEDALSDKKDNEYLAHLIALKERDGAQEITQQVQIAHSDNARRAGAIASRGIIHEGHRAAREAIKKYNVNHPELPAKLQFYQGGSLSDSYRNGVRAATAMMKDFDMSDFAKMTFQGGDTLNYFNQSTSMKRLLLRGIVQQTELLENGNHHEGEHTALESVVVETISELQKKYDANFYRNDANPLGKILHALDYRAQAAVGSAGTRGNRTVQGSADEATTGVNAKDMRTISFSETFQHGGLHPSCLGTEGLRYGLNINLFQNKEALAEFNAGFEKFKEKEILGKVRQGKDTPIDKDSIGMDQNHQLTAAGLHYLYKEGSATFKDAIDKMTYSLLNTRIKDFSEKLTSYQKKTGGTDQALVSAFHGVLDEYKEASWLVHDTLSGQSLDNAAKHQLEAADGITAVDRFRHMIKPQLEHLEMHYYKHDYLDGLELIAKAAGLENSRLLHNAKDTVYHGRTFTADDPKYGKGLMAYNKILAGQVSQAI